MRNRLQICLVLVLAVVSCKKGYDGGPTVQPPPPPPAPTVLLKEIVISSLPSPYYHFDYNAAGQISSASFASGLDMYQVTYDHGKVSEMINSGPANSDHLKYFYDNSGRANLVNYINFNGIIDAKVQFEYDGQKLVSLSRQKKINDNFLVDKIMNFSYYPDGNVSEIIQHRFAVAGQVDATYTDKFEQYDDKINVDGFNLIHDDFFDNLVLLPGVQLQKNNPRMVIRSGDGLNFMVESTYTYSDKNAPLIQNGKITVLNGANAGEVIQTQTTYSYY